MKKIKTAIVDLHCPVGHINLINFYIKSLIKNTSLLILNKSIKNFIEYKADLYIDYNKNFIKKIFTFFHLYSLMVNNKINQVIFLSYDPIYFLIFSRLLIKKKIKIYIFEHDTLNKRKYVRFFCNKFIDKKTIRLVYNNEKKIFVKKNFQTKVNIIDHPLLKDNKLVNKIYSGKIKKFEKKIINNHYIKILIPTRDHIDKKYFFSFIKKFSRKAYFITLSKKIKTQVNNLINLKNIKTNLIKHMDFIYLPNDNRVYDTRISSWVYVAIAYNKKVILEKSISSNYEKKRFPQFIIEAKKFKLKKIKKMNIQIHKKFINNYNRNAIIRLKEIIFNT